MNRRTLFMMVLIALGVFAGAGGQATDAGAANGYEQWTAGWDDGCAYFWDGFAYTEAACPQPWGGFDMYAPVNGQWVYMLSFSVYDTGEIYYVGNQQAGAWAILDRFGMVTTSSAGQGSLMASNDPLVFELLMRIEESRAESVKVWLD